MLRKQNYALVLLALTALVVGGCASYRYSEPIEVNLVGAEPLPGEGMELRMLLKLRVQNPNDSPLDYDGMSAVLDIRGRRFATGVSDATGSVPRFGETIIEFPISVSALGLARQAVSISNDKYQGKLPYELKGQLAGATFMPVHFQSEGELELPSNFFGYGW